MSDFETTGDHSVFEEQPLACDTYEQAARAACAFVQPPPDLQKLKFYKGRLGSGADKIVGVGLPGTSTVLDLVRLDVDNAKKGIHFNARKVAGDNEHKLAAFIKPTVDMSVEERKKLYEGYLVPLQTIGAAVTLWNIWASGRRPTGDEVDIVEEESAA
ncbi:hypothetical protein EW026_g4207 [Hermanssonia centrifuga]|uniref:Uncharacterized protein n=1 Tax=Hermanssonia centrifuga TaxID=98765 RepID=A0A4S4KHX3_9APHY|nr:hypothetical protein EW026_g4207 [Hermanssonia centrifuga]